MSHGASAARCAGLPANAPSVPGLRGLALGYTLSPATRVCELTLSPFQAALLPRAARTCPGLYAIAHCVGL